MTTREALRTRLGIDGRATGPNAPKENDEEILNVLRKEHMKDGGEDELTTNEIAERLSIGSKQTHNRLTELERNDRVEKRRAGQTDMWSLAPEEPGTVMNPDLGPVIKQSTRARQKAVNIKKNGLRLSAAGFIFLIIGMTIWMSELPLFPIFLDVGYSFGVVGALIVMVGIVLRFAGIATPRLTERFLLE